MHTSLDYLELSSIPPFWSYEHRLSTYFLSDHAETPPGFVPAWGADPACLGFSPATFRVVGSGNGLTQESWYDPLRHPGLPRFELRWRGGTGTDRPISRHLPLL